MFAHLRPGQVSSVQPELCFTLTGCKHFQIVGAELCDMAERECAMCPWDVWAPADALLELHQPTSNQQGSDLLSLNTPALGFKIGKPIRCPMNISFNIGKL